MRQQQQPQWVKAIRGFRANVVSDNGRFREVKANEIVQVSQYLARELVAAKKAEFSDAPVKAKEPTSPSTLSSDDKRGDGGGKKGKE